MEKQKLLEIQKIKYSYGPYNKIKGDKQMIRITEGCPNGCPYCYETNEIKIFDIPKIEKNKVLISDMNLLCKKQSLEIINKLGSIRVDDKVVYYELVCGIDFRFLTQELADALYKNRFIDIRIAWDWRIDDQYKIRKTINKLIKAGYHVGKSSDITIFMICNWKIPYSECLCKMDLCKVWNVKIVDCYFDNQTSPNIIPIFWSDEMIKDFRKKVRKHNQIVNFGIDPEIKEKF